MSSRVVRARLKEYALLLRLHRPIGTLLLLWPVLWALWIAGAGHPSMHVLAVFVAGTILMRSAGCAINDYADRHFDPHVERTRDRPLAAGRVSPREALILFVVLSLAAFALVLTLTARSCSGPICCLTRLRTRSTSCVFPQIPTGSGRCT